MNSNPTPSMMIATTSKIVCHFQSGCTVNAAVAAMSDSAMVMNIQTYTDR